jgi:hypothetical protein
LQYAPYYNIIALLGVVSSMDYKQKILDMADEILKWSLVDLKDMPRIPLYMEQVTSFFDEALAGARRGDDDKILTKTMINNYTKEGTLPRPHGKKYSREHMIRLMYIFMLKQILSLQDIRQMFDQLQMDVNIESMYGAYLELVDGYKEQFRQSLVQKMEAVQEKLDGKGAYTVENFEMMLMLLTVTEATAGKMLIWRMLDGLSESKRQGAEAPGEKR